MVRICRVFIAIVLLASVASVQGMGEAKVDPSTGQIRVLYMGDALMEAGFVTPIIAQDPMIRINPIPVEFLTGLYASIDDAARGLRAYFPRVERQVYGEYDAIIITDAREPFFPHKIQVWVRNAVVDHGLGFLMAGGPQSFGGYDAWGHPSWGDSVVGGILPVRCLRDWQWANDVFRMVPAAGQEDHPLVKGIPWQFIILYDLNRVEARPGSTVVGVSDSNPPKSPILVYSDMGQGISEAFVFDWGGRGPAEFHRSEYAPIILSNMIYWIARVPIPEDTTLLLRFRNQMTKYLSGRRFVLSVMDFAEKFGANINRAEGALKESDGDKREVISLYVSGNLEGGLQSLESAIARLDEVSGLAMEAKDQALLWVYLIEWFTVSGTAMLSGSVVWALMVKRAAYREVGVTRFDNL